MAALVTRNKATVRMITTVSGPGEDVPKRNGAGIELLADPTRRRIIAALAIHPRRPSSLASEIGLSRPAITRQLHLLLDAGLVRWGRSMADRRAVLYMLEPRHHGAITAWLAGTDIGRRSLPAARDEVPGAKVEILERGPRRAETRRNVIPLD